MADDKQVNEAAFLKALNKKKAAAKAAAKEKRPAGILDDDAIRARLGLTEEGASVALNGRVSKITFGFAKNDTDRPFFSFGYSLSENSPLSDKGKGLLISNYIEVAEMVDRKGEVWRDEEESLKQLFYEFQALGEDTSSWGDPLKDAVEAAKRHTKNKTEIQLSLNCYKSGNTGNLGLGKRVVNVETDNSDLDTEEEDSEEEDSEEVTYADWVGHTVDWTDDDGTVTGVVKSYDEDNDQFEVETEDGDIYEAPCDQCEVSDEEDSDDE